MNEISSAWSLLFLIIPVIILVIWRNRQRKRDRNAKEVSDEKNDSSKEKLGWFYNKSKGIIDWWNDAKTEKAEKRRWLYIILVIVAYFVAPITNKWIFKPEDAPLYGYIAAAVFVLIGLHIIWTFWSDKKSWMTGVVVYGMLVYILWLGWKPVDATNLREAGLMGLEKVSKSLATGVSCFVGHEGCVKEVPATASVTAVAPQPRETVVEVTATEYGKFKEVKIPINVLFKWYCLDNNVLVAVAHRGDPQGTYYDCDEYVDIGSHLRDLRIGFSPKIRGETIRAIMTFTHPS